MYSPRWLFFLPGVTLIVLGCLAYVIAMPGMTIHGITFDVHTLLFGSLAILCGCQAILFAIFTKVFAVNEGLMPEDPRMTRFFEIMYLERGLLLSGAGLVVGLGLLIAAILQWKLTGFGTLDYTKTMRLVIPGATVTALGFQIMLSSFFASILGMRRR